MGSKVKQLPKFREIRPKNATEPPTQCPPNVVRLTPAQPQPSHPIASQLHQDRPMASQFHQTQQPIASQLRPVQQPMASQLPCQESDVKIYRQVAGITTKELLSADEEGNTGLHLAIVHGRAKLVEALLDRLQREQLLDRAVSMVNRQNQTLLCMAVFTNQPAMVRMLLERGSDVNVRLRKESEGGRPANLYHLLHYIATRGSALYPILEMILAVTKVEVNCRNSQGQTPLHCAIEAHGRPVSSSASGETIDSLKTIYLLAQHGALLNAQETVSGRSCLHCVVERRDAQFLEWFLQFVAHMHGVAGSAGAALHELLNTRAHCGRTPAQLAASLGLSDTERGRMLQLLNAAGGQGENRHSAVRRT